VIPFVLKFNVSLVFEHHDHAYKRTVVLSDLAEDGNSGTVAAPGTFGTLFVGDGSLGIGSRGRTVKRPLVPQMDTGGQLCNEGRSCCLTAPCLAPYSTITATPWTSLFNNPRQHPGRVYWITAARMPALQKISTCRKFSGLPNTRLHESTAVKLVLVVQVYFPEPLLF
jgi:hypothetical protein